MAATPPFDPYRLLGVARQATADEIGRAHRRLAKGSHPDLHGPQAAERMQAINRAWHLLSDSVRRAEWDAAHPLAPASAAHWAAAPARPAPSAAGWPGPAPAATWSSGPSPAAAGAPRARPASAMPRPADLPRSVRDSGWLAAMVGAAVILAAIGLGWVAAQSPGAASLGQAVAQNGIQAENTVRLDARNALVVHRPSAGEVGIVHFFQGQDDRWTWGLADARAARGARTVAILVPDPGDGEQRWGTFVFGRADPLVDRVELLELGGVGGEVFAGTWAIALPVRLVDVAGLRWQFVADDGRVLLSGRGETGD